MMEFQIYAQIAALSDPNNGWTKELNLISWNKREPVYDIRAWTEDHSRCGKGVTLTEGEMRRLKEALQAKTVF